MSRLSHSLNKMREVVETEFEEHIAITTKKDFSAAIKAKREMSRDFTLLDGNNFKEAIYGKKFYVTKKLDGIFVYGSAYIHNKKVITRFATSSGDELKDLRCLKEFTEYMEKENIRMKGRSVVPADFHVAFLMELYLPGEKRTRVADVLHALACEKKDELALAIFQREDKAYRIREDDEPYDSRLKYAADLFSGAKQISTVPYCVVEAGSEETVDDLRNRVSEIYNQWVVKEGAEGLVVRNENGAIWKIKPRHTIDAAAIGFAQDTDGTLRDIMFAVLDKDGKYHRFACGATGLSYEDKEQLLSYFQKRIMPSVNFSHANSAGIPYKMVYPGKVFEISCVDLASKKGDEKPCKNDLLIFDGDSWQTKGLVNGASCHGLSVVRERDDKSCVYEDIRLEQLSQISPFSEKEDSVDFENLPESSVLDVHVYKKQKGKSYYAKKFIIWKTNKEQTKFFPPYILYYEDFSSRRQKHIKRDMFTAETYDEAKKMLNPLISKHVKEGWTYVC